MMMNAESKLGQRLNGKVYRGQQERFQVRFKAYKDRLPSTRALTRQFGPWVKDLILRAKMDYYSEHRKKERQRFTVPFWFLNEVIRRLRRGNMGCLGHMFQFTITLVETFAKKMVKLLEAVKGATFDDTHALSRASVLLMRGVDFEPFAEEFAGQVRKIHGMRDNTTVPGNWPKEGFGGKGFGKWMSTSELDDYYRRRNLLTQQIRQSDEAITVVF